MYELTVNPGSGWEGANFLLTLTIPSHGIWPKRYITVRSFRTQEEAEQERVKLLTDIVQQARAVV